MATDANNYQNLIPVDNGAFEIYREFNDSPFANPLVRLCVKILRDNERNKDLPKSDFPSLTSHIPVFSERAVSVLNELLAANGEFVKLDCVDCEEPYFAFNVTTTVQVLDPDHSELKRF